MPELVDLLDHEHLVLVERFELVVFEAVEVLLSHSMLDLATIPERVNEDTNGDAGHKHVLTEVSERVLLVCHDLAPEIEGNWERHEHLEDTEAVHHV